MTTPPQASFTYYLWYPAVTIDMNTSIGWVKDHECPAYTAVQTLTWTAGPENAYITESSTGVIVIDATTRAAEAAVVCTITNSVYIADNPGIV